MHHADPAQILAKLRADLRDKADPAHRDGSRHFFKEAINPLGVRSKDLSLIIRSHWPQVKALPPGALLSLCEELWTSGVFEEPVVASKWCARALPALGAGAFATYEDWLARRVDNWGHCDVLCTQCLGGLVALHPELVERTLPWTESPNRWLRRGSAVCIVPPARHGMLLGHVFRICDMLLDDEDDLVRKGFGWLLREASRVWPREVLEFVLQRRSTMPRVALRCAIELLPADWRAQAMSKP